MKPVREYIRERVEATLLLSKYMVLTEQPFGNKYYYYLIDPDSEELCDVVSLSFQHGYFNTGVKSVVWSGHVAGTPEGKVTRRQGVLPNGLGMIYYNENKKDNLSKLREYFNWMKQRFVYIEE